MPTPDQFGENRSYLYTTMAITEKWGMLTAFLCVPVPNHDCRPSAGGSGE